MQTQSVAVKQDYHMPPARVPDPARFPRFDADPSESYELYRAESMDAARTWVARLMEAFPHFARMRAAELYDCACSALKMEFLREPNPYEAALLSGALKSVVGNRMAVVEG